jgi:hypothetical protein
MYFRIFLVRAPARGKGCQRYPTFLRLLLSRPRAKIRIFLIGPRNEKQRKKRSAVKILHSLVQITSCHF